MYRYRSAMIDYHLRLDGSKLVTNISIDREQGLCIDNSNKFTVPGHHGQTTEHRTSNIEHRIKFDININLLMLTSFDKF